MRKWGMLIFIFCASMLYGEEQLLTFEAENTPIVEVLGHIKARGKLNIAYAPNLLKRLDGEPISVTLRVKKQKASLCLQAVAASGGLKVKTVGPNFYVVEPPLEEDVYQQVMERFLRRLDKRGEKPRY